MWNIRHRHTPLTFAAMLLALLLSACVTTDDYSDQDSLRDDETVSLTLNIYTNQPYAATRALTGDVNGRTDQPESIIYDIQVWAFTHNGGDNEQAIAYAEAENINKSELEMRMYISKEHVVAKHKLDLYILANPKSIGLTGNNKVPASITRATLKATSFGNDHFGTTTLTHAVPTSQGLPISQVSCLLAPSASTLSCDEPSQSFASSSRVLPAPTACKSRRLKLTKILSPPHSSCFPTRATSTT